MGLLGQPGAGHGGLGAVEDRDLLLRLLGELPARQRTAVVLRYWEELSEAEAAQAMGCSLGTVKSAASRGLRRLRELSGVGEVDGAPQPAGRTS